MGRLTKIIITVPVFVFCLLAMADVLSGGEPLIDETVILGMGALWFAYLIKPFKPPAFLLAFLLFLASTVIHNIVSHLLQTEEPFFFITALLSLAVALILLLVFIFKKAREKLLKHVSHSRS